MSPQRVALFGPGISNHQVYNTGNVRLVNATVSDATAALSCDDMPEILEPEESVECSGFFVLYWAAIEAGSVITTSRLAPDDGVNALHIECWYSTTRYVLLPHPK